MSSTTIFWDETNPADSKNAGLGAGDIRSILSNVRGGLDAEHLWPSSGGLSGGHRQGSAVVFYGTASKVSSADTDGRVMLTSDTSMLWGVGSTATVPLGGRYAAFHVAAQVGRGPTFSNHTSTVTQKWTLETGYGTMKNGSNLTVIPYASSFVAAPVVTLTKFDSALTLVDIPLLADVGASSFQVNNCKHLTGLNGNSATTYEFAYTLVGYVAA